MDKSKIALICNTFGLDTLVSIENMGGSRNISYLLMTSKGSWIARNRYTGYAEEIRIQFDHSAMQHLANDGVPVITPHARPDGSTWWRDGDDTWEIYQFITGRHLHEGDSKDMLALGKELAEFHQSGASFKLRYDKIGPRGETDLSDLSATSDKLLKAYPEISDDLSPYLQLLKQAANDLDMAAYIALPHTLIHGDVQPANILMRDGDVAAFVDLDWCAWRPRIYDLCFALLCCSPHAQPVGEGNIWQITQMPVIDAGQLKAFMACYQQHSSTLTPPEISALGPQLALTWCSMRLHGALKVSRNELHSFLVRDSDMDIKGVFREIMSSLVF